MPIKHLITDGYHLSFEQNTGTYNKHFSPKDKNLPEIIFNLHIVVFLVTIPPTEVGLHQHLGGTYCLRPQGTLNMEAV
jgi:hypothetical protein